MVRTIDINADMGEGFGKYDIGNDAEMLKIITTANLACGMHGGDPLIMADRAAQARENGVGIGAHPGYPDLWGFGRRTLDMTGTELAAYITYQIGAMQAMAKLSGHRMTHVKTHGALGHMTGDNEEAGEALIRSIKAIDPDLILMVMAGTGLEAQAEAAGLRVAREIFADRTYEDNGRLMSRKKAGSMVHDPAQAAENISRMVAEGAIISVTGKRIPLKGIETVCTHGDSEGALAIARAVRDRLLADGCLLQPVSVTMNG